MYTSLHEGTTLFLAPISTNRAAHRAEHQRPARLAAGEARTDDLVPRAGSAGAGDDVPLERLILAAAWALDSKTPVDALADLKDAEGRESSDFFTGSIQNRQSGQVFGFLIRCCKLNHSLIQLA